MPTRSDKGHTEKDGSGAGGGQKATSGMTRTPGATGDHPDDREELEQRDHED